MRAGDIIDDQYELLRRAGAGGMGEVFQARDRRSGETVAIKVLLRGQASEGRRFEREARVLSELRHPGIVHYIAHGVTGAGNPYLVMEWLDGEELTPRLKRGELTAGEAVVLVRRVAEALAAAHARGVIHRDIKPSNLFLVGGHVEQVKLLDFGIAHIGGATRLTGDGMFIGTPGYMAPEQARGGAEIDARADVFSLGCVMFECLTGRGAFLGEHLMAVLVKILLEEVPRLRELRPEVSPHLDALVSRMLAKEPSWRPRDGAAVAAELAAIDRGLATSPAPTAEVLAGREPSALTWDERLLLCVVLIGLEQPFDAGARPTARPTVAMAIDPELSRVVVAHGGTLERLTDGSLIVTLVGAMAADQAVRSARCALALRALLPGRPMALATGRATAVTKRPIGGAIDRAVGLLARHPPSPREPAIAVDEVTARVLEARFKLEGGVEGIAWLRGELEITTGARTLLGERTACVGRDTEFAMLETLWAGCIDEPRSQAVLVTAPAGTGKSRLAHEMVLRIQQRGVQVALWLGRGDPMRAGSPFGLLGQALRSALGVRDGSPIGARQHALRRRVAAHVPEAERGRVTEFLGELLSTPFPDEQSPVLRAARQDAQLMGDQMRRAWIDLLRAETAAHPVLIVLDDLHWGDLPTVRFVDAALRELQDQPWMVVALARPEVHDLFPRLGVHEICLRALSPRASERLVRLSLGDAVHPGTVQRLVAQAQGNAFYLEELIRAVAAGQGETLPETVLAMIEARLAALEAGARRALRAASVFGEVCWSGALEALLTGTWSTDDLRRGLSTLVEQELLVNRMESRFPGQTELAFRHALLRESAYATLTDNDRKLGHRLAAEWLEQHGESDPLVLAEHFRRGGELARAGAYYLRAAEQANHGGDTETAIALSRRGLEGDIPASARVALLGLLCNTHGLRREWAAAGACSEELLRVAVPGSFPAMIGAALRCILSRHPARMEEFASAMLAGRDTAPPPDSMTQVAFGYMNACAILTLGGRGDLMESVARCGHARLATAVAQDVVARAWLLLSDGVGAWSGAGVLWRSAQAARASVGLFAQAEHRQGVSIARCIAGIGWWVLGAFAEARRELEAGQAGLLGLGTAQAAVCSILALADAGALEQAQREASEFIARSLELGLGVEEAAGRLANAAVLRRRGELQRAEREAVAVLESELALPIDQLAAGVELAATLHAWGRTAEALAAAEAAMARYACQETAFGFRGGFARLVHAEVLHAAGEHERSRATLRGARDHLLAQAAAIPDGSLRRKYLEGVPENARVLELSRRWLDDGDT
ncbi:protein kinase [Sorangium sp. So ce119]|uniref:protein kinase domain-containing protein n=1 Tax=Sorangium sp. So ce119 TaxID=3133279 RepID=UPI003F611C29